VNGHRRCFLFLNPADDDAAVDRGEWLELRFPEPRRATVK
jgi:hypothetical protein